MDFTRGTRSNHGGTTNSTETTTQASTSSNVKTGKSKKELPKSIRIAWVIFFISIIILLAALFVYILFGAGSKATDSRYVVKDDYQAVFLTNGQVYFGRIVGLNSDYVRLQDIYYLAPTQTVQPTEGEQAQATDYTLVKLGCELHGPQDQMIIERNQVTFWENLKSDGKVTQGIRQFQQANPNGLNCEEQQTNNQGNN